MTYERRYIMARRKSQKFNENPFMKELMDNSSPTWRSRTIAAENGTLLVANPRTGEIPDDLRANRGLVMAQRVEANEFVKIYANGINEVASLSSAGLKVLYLFLNAVRGGKPNKDKITMYYPALSEEEQKKMSYRVFLNGINNLIEKNFIAESVVPNEFFINPDYVFNGNRLALIKLYEVENKDKENDNDEKEESNENKEKLREVEEKMDRNGTRYEEPKLFNEK